MALRLHTHGFDVQCKTDLELERKMTAYKKLLMGVVLGISAAALPVSAAVIVCGNGALGTRTVTVNPGLAGGTCYAQNGNLQVADYPNIAAGIVEVDKDTTGDFPVGDQSEGALQFTRLTSTSGTFSFADALWDIYDRLFIAFHFGGGGDTPSDNPDSFAVELAARDIFGTYALGGGQLNGLSNIDLLGVPCVPGQPCNPPGRDVPEPGTLLLFGIGLSGLAFRLRRRAA